MMTFSTRPWQAAFTAWISASTWPNRPSFTQPRFTTMSISAAPDSTAWVASAALMGAAL